MMLIFFFFLLLLQENVPNIAGLLRTSEIMGVGEFAIPELRLVREEAFRRVSMTAERHVNLVGVGRNDISRYLAEKKTQGYTVIGVRLPARSISCVDNTLRFCR